MTAPHLRPVDDPADLPPYPFARGDRLPSHFFVAFWHRRWLNSSLCLRAPLDVQGAALNLFWISQDQSPIGTLPTDPDLLAALLRIPVAELNRLCDCPKVPRGPLHNWRPYICDNGEIRLGHETVVEVLEDAFARRQAHEQAKGDRAVKARLMRLRDGIDRHGVARPLLDDDTFIEQLDGWLSDNWPKGRRTPEAYLRALDHAAAAGWIDAAKRRINKGN